MVGDNKSGCWWFFRSHCSCQNTCEMHILSTCKIWKMKRKLPSALPISNTASRLARWFQFSGTKDLKSKSSWRWWIPTLWQQRFEHQSHFCSITRVDNFKYFPQSQPSVLAPTWPDVSPVLISAAPIVNAIKVKAPVRTPIVCLLGALWTVKQLVP